MKTRGTTGMRNYFVEVFGADGEVRVYMTYGRRSPAHARRRCAEYGRTGRVARTTAKSKLAAELRELRKAKYR